jgi:hypothetical protein
MLFVASARTILLFCAVEMACLCLSMQAFRMVTLSFMAWEWGKLGMAVGVLYQGVLLVPQYTMHDFYFTRGLALSAHSDLLCSCTCS